MRAAPAMVEVVEGRGLNQRLWRSTEWVEEVDPSTGQVIPQKRVSRVTEVGDFLCYRDAKAEWTPSTPRWETDGASFRAAGVGYQVVAPATVGEVLRYLPAGDDREVHFRPNGLSLVEGETQTPLRSVVPTTGGELSATDPTKLVYANALGDGIDIEIELTASGFHQNVLFRKELPLAKTDGVSLLLETEMNLDDLAGVDGRAVAAGGVELSTEAATDPSAEAREDQIAFLRQEDGVTRESWSFGASRVFTTAGGVAKETAVAKKKLARREGTYLQETLPGEVLTDAVEKGALPLVWDFVTIQNPINQTTVWRGGYTYWVKNCTVSNTTTPITLTIEPGATIKREMGTTFAISTNAKLIAIGEAYAPITFTSANDAKCGEVVTGAGANRPSRLVEILNGSTAGSTVRYCKFTRGQSSLLYLTVGSINPIENSVFLTEIAGAIAVEAYPPSGTMFGLTVRNNLFASPAGISTPLFLYTSNYQSLTVTNNTFARAANGSGAVYFYKTGSSGGLTARENIFDQCGSDPLYTGGTVFPSFTANAYRPTRDSSEPLGPSPLS